MASNDSERFPAAGGRSCADLLYDQAILRAINRCSCASIAAFNCTRLGVTIGMKALSRSRR